MPSTSHFYEVNFVHFMKTAINRLLLNYNYQDSDFDLISESQIKVNPEVFVKMKVCFCPRRINSRNSADIMDVYLH